MTDDSRADAPSALCALLDLARSHSQLPSDYAVAKRLGVPTQVVSNWRHGRKYPGLLDTFNLARMAGRPADEVLAELELERASRAGRALQAVAWREQLDKLTAGALAVIMSVGLSGVSTDASAMPFDTARASISNTPGSVYYVNLLARLVRRLRARFAVCRPSAWWPRGESPRHTMHLAAA